MARDAYFTVSNSLEPRVDATGLVVALEDGLWNAGGHGALAVLSQVALSTQATVYAAGGATLGLQYSLMNRPRAADPPPLRFPAGRPPSARALVTAGEVALSARKVVGGDFATVDGAVFLPLDPRAGVTVTGKAWRTLSERMSAALDATVSLQERALTLALSATRQLGVRSSASLSWAAGAVPGVGFSVRRDAYDEYTDTEARTGKGGREGGKFERPEDAFDDGESDAGSGTGSGSDDEEAVGLFRRRKDELIPVAAVLRQLRPLAVVVSPHVWAPVGARLSLRMAGAEPSVGVTLRRPIGAAAPLLGKSEPTGGGGGHVKVRTQVGLSGWEVEAGGGQRYIVEDTAWSTSVVIGTHGVMLRFKIHRSGHRFHLPIVLVSTTADAKTATVAAICLSALTSAVQILVIKPWQDAANAEVRTEAKRARAAAMQQAKAEAEASRELMQRVVAGSIEREGGLTDGGLLIVRAVYGLRGVVAAARLDGPSFAGREIEAEAAEVGECVQMLVEDSRVQLVSSTKSTILGFWDPTAMGDEDKALRIWYRFRGAMHDCIVDDWAPLELPLSTHRVDAP